MLRVLTLSTLFPNAARPTFGVFVERQTSGLAALPGVEVEVVSPLGLPPWPLTLHPHYRDRARLPAEESWKGLRVHRPRFTLIPRLGEARTASAMARALLPMLRRLRERFPFDVIDAEFFWPDGPAAMALSRALGVPFSVKARGSDINYWSGRPGVLPQLLEAARKADGLLAVSDALRSAMTGLGMPADNIRVHHTGVDRDLFAPIDRAAAKAKLGVAGPLIATAGTLSERKGQQHAIAALSVLPDATLLLVGDGPDRARLEALARTLGVAGRVRFLGNRPHAELPALLAAADVMLLPSASEGLANVWVEAIACGTPVVTCDAGGGAREVIVPANGRIVPPDPAALAAAVGELLAVPPDPQAVRATVDRFSWRRNAAELRDHLAAIAGAAAKAA